jgi:serine/threonine protein kinase
MVKSDLEVKLVDFGYSEVIPRPKGKQTKYCGTPFYVPPEFIKQEPSRGIQFIAFVN